MASTLSWNLHGNDQLSAVLEHLDRTLGGLSRRLDGVTSDAKRMGSTLGAAEAPAQRFGSGTQIVTGHLDGLSSGLTRVIDKARFFAVAMSTAAAAAVVSVGVMGFKVAAANESAMISFELMLGSADKAKRFLADLKAFNLATPFELPQLRSAASRLLAVGTAAKDVIPILAALGDVTSGMGTGAEGIERAITALSQMKQKTKVTGEEMMQLTEAGIPAWEALATFLKVDVATAMKMVEKRAVGAEAIFAAIQTRSGSKMQALTGLMSRQATTLEGVWSNFKDAANEALGKIAEPALPGLKKLVLFAGTAVPTILGKLRDMATGVAGIFAGSDVPERFVASLEKLGNEVLPKLESSWNKLLQTTANHKDGLEKLGRLLADFVIPLMGSSLVASIDMTTAALQAVIWVAAHVVDQIQVMASMFLSQLGMIVHAADAAFGWIPGLGPKLHEATAKFDQFANSVMDKLDALDGKARGNAIVGVSGWSAQRNSERRATGGPVWAGMSYVGGEFGPEPFIAATTGTVQPTNRAAAYAGGGDQVIGVLRVIHETPEGSKLREELLKLKANKGLLTLGLG